MLPAEHVGPEGAQCSRHGHLRHDSMCCKRYHLLDLDATALDPLRISNMWVFESAGRLACNEYVCTAQSSLVVACSAGVTQQFAPQWSLGCMSFDMKITTRAQVLVWDMRGGRAPARQLGARGPEQHPLLAAFRLHEALGRVPDLASQTDVPASSVDALLADPRDDRRAAFALASGWAGVRPCGTLGF